MNKQSMFKLIVVILSVLFLATAITSVVLAVKYSNSNKELAELNSQLEDGKSKLDEQISANESLKEENSSQAESFSQQYEKQSKENQSKVDELNKKIKDLNKQLAAKKNPATTKKNNNSGPVTLPKPTPAKGKTVYLTFDDGPSSYTPQILDTLDKYGVKATFFVKNGGKYN